MKKLVTGAAMAVLFFAVRLAWNLITYEPAPEATASDLAAEFAEYDAEVERQIASGEAAPALDWLSSSENMLFEGDPQTVQSLIEDLHRSGAPSVWFMDIEELAGKKISASIAVELPEDPATRASLLKAEADFWQETEVREDLGQRYLAFSFD
jgi:hypothetical protein